MGKTHSIVGIDGTLSYGIIGLIVSVSAQNKKQAEYDNIKNRVLQLHILAESGYIVLAALFYSSMKSQISSTSWLLSGIGNIAQSCCIF